MGRDQVRLKWMRGDSVAEWSKALTWTTNEIMVKYIRPEWVRILLCEITIRHLLMQSLVMW